MSRNAPLSVTVDDGRLVIAIGVETLGFAAQHSDDFEKWGVTVVDHDIAVKEIARELRREEEDGTTLVHLLLDKAALNAWENGGEGFAERPDKDTKI